MKEILKCYLSIYWFYLAVSMAAIVTIWAGVFFTYGVDGDWIVYGFSVLACVPLLYCIYTPFYKAWREWQKKKRAEAEDRERHQQLTAFGNPD